MRCAGSGGRGGPGGCDRRDEVEGGGPVERGAPDLALLHDGAAPDAPQCDPSGPAGGVDEHGVVTAGRVQPSDVAQRPVEGLPLLLQAAGLLERQRLHKCGLPFLQPGIEAVAVTFEHVPHGVHHLACTLH